MVLTERERAREREREWMRINKLSPNLANTEYMIIGHSRKLNTLDTSNPLKINGTDIKPVTKTKSLRIVVDENLSWDGQYKTLKGKIYGGLSSFHPSIRCLAS